MQQHPTVPRKWAGKWIAWDNAMTRVVASGITAAEAKAAAELVGESKPVLDKAPPIDVHLIGARMR